MNRVRVLDMPESGLLYLRMMKRRGVRSGAKWCLMSSRHYRVLRSLIDDWPCSESTAWRLEILAKSAIKSFQGVEPIFDLLGIAKEAYQTLSVLQPSNRVQRSRRRHYDSYATPPKFPTKPSAI